MSENSTDDEKTVEKVAEQRKRLWARRENNGDETDGRKNGCTLRQKIARTTRERWDNWRKRGNGYGQDENRTVKKVAEVAEERTWYGRERGIVGGVERDELAVEVDRTHVPRGRRKQARWVTP